MDTAFMIGNQTQVISNWTLSNIAENIQISVNGVILPITLISGSARIPDGLCESMLVILQAMDMMMSSSFSSDHAFLYDAAGFLHSQTTTTTTTTAAASIE